MSNLWWAKGQEHPMKGKSSWNKGKKLHYKVWNKGIKGLMIGYKFPKGHIPWNKGKTKEDYPQLSCSGVKKSNKPWNAGKDKKQYPQLGNSGVKVGQFVDEKHPNWKGDKVSYLGMHTWINNKLGKPDECQFCGKNKLFGKKIHWANISGKYKRNYKDWIRLCVSCHKKFDTGRDWKKYRDFYLEVMKKINERATADKRTI